MWLPCLCKCVRQNHRQGWHASQDMACISLNLLVQSNVSEEGLLSFAEGWKRLLKYMLIRKGLLPRSVHYPLLPSLPTHVSSNRPRILEMEEEFLPPGYFLPSQLWSTASRDCKATIRSLKTTEAKIGTVMDRMWLWRDWSPPSVMVHLPSAPPSTIREDGECPVCNCSCHFNGCGCG